MTNADANTWEPQARPVAFYHVAAIGHWKEILTEQLSLLKKSGFDGMIYIGFIGQQYEDGFISRVANAIGLSCEIRTFGSDMRQYEFPTLRWCHQFCQEAPDGPVLYFHCKAVSNTSWPWVMWRWLMNALNLADWRRATDALQRHNCAGASWHANAFPVSYFPGNFWWARVSFVRQLTALDDYIKQFEDCIRHRNPHGFSRRHAAECWINSRKNAQPFIAGPPASRFWDHKWWTSREAEEWCAVAYKQGH